MAVSGGRASKGSKNFSGSHEPCRDQQRSQQGRAGPLKARHCCGEPNNNTGLALSFKLVETTKAAGGLSLVGGSFSAVRARTINPAAVPPSVERTVPRPALALPPKQSTGFRCGAHQSNIGVPGTKASKAASTCWRKRSCSIRSSWRLPGTIRCEPARSLIANSSIVGVETI
jgi:hypothetical protein